MYILYYRKRQVAYRIMSRILKKEIKKAEIDTIFTKKTLSLHKKFV